MLRRPVLIAAAAAAVAAPALCAPAAFAERLVAADANNRLYTFDSASPEKWTRTKAVSGLAAGERIVGLDVRPVGRQLIALTNRSRLYSVQRTRAIAMPIGGNPFMPALAGAAFGFDFNPTVDRIRVVSDSGQNLRLNPESGAVAFTDAALRYMDGDRAAGSTPSVIGAAYTNSVRGAMATTLYVIDTRKDALAIQAPPNEGVLTTVGPLRVNLSGPLGFDISARDGKAYVLAHRPGTDRSRLFSINLATGNARKLGIVRRAPDLVAFAALSKPPT
jgi:hypothetical protein